MSGDTFSGVPSGLYTITVVDTLTGCSKEVMISVPEAIPPTVTATSGIVGCFGASDGTFEMTINGYSGPYTYEIFDSNNNSIVGPINADTSINPLTINGMDAGVFTVLITETATPFCTATANVVISSPANPLDVVVSETSNVTCDNSQGTITAIASGGWGDYEYELSGAANVGYSSNNVFSNLSAGDYTVNVRDAEGCIVSANITLTELHHTRRYRCIR